MGTEIIMGFLGFTHFAEGLNKKLLDSSMTLENRCNARNSFDSIRLEHRLLARFQFDGK